jgi:Helix-turn-helix domain
MSRWALHCARHHSGARRWARLVLLELAGYPNPDGPNGVWARTQTIADGCGVSRRLVQGAYKELEAAGLIKVELQAGQHGTNRVRVILCPSCAERAHKGDQAEGAKGAQTVRTPSGAERAHPGAQTVRTRGFEGEAKPEEGGGSELVALRETQWPVSPDPPHPLSVDQYIRAFVTWMRGDRNPTYTLTGETERELREHLTALLARDVDPRAIVAGLKAWATDPKGPGPIALPRYVDRAQRNPATAGFGIDPEQEAEDLAEAERQRQENQAKYWARMSEAVRSIDPGAECAGGVWTLSDGTTLPNPIRTTAWLMSHGVELDP